MLSDAERTDREEDARHGAGTRGDELPEALRTSSGRLARLKQAKARLEEREKEAEAAQAEKIRRRLEEEEQSGRKKRGRKPKAPEAVADPTSRANATDPQSRILKTRRGWVQGYNAQAMADCTTQVIVAQDVTQEENDVKQLAPMLSCCQAQAGERPEQLLADAGYWSEENAGREGAGTELLIATTKDHKQSKALREQGPPRGRIPKHATRKELMERKLRTKRGRAAYKERGSTIEPVFGQMEMRGLSRFQLRGKAKVRLEWSLWCTTHNLLKLWRAGAGSLNRGMATAAEGTREAHSSCDAVTRRSELRGVSRPASATHPESDGRSEPLYSYQPPFGLMDRLQRAW